MVRKALTWASRRSQADTLGDGRCDRVSHAPKGYATITLFSVRILYMALLFMPARTVALPQDNPTRRMALLVGHAFGGGNLQPLRYVGQDIERMRNALIVAGGFLPSDIIVSFGEDTDTVLDKLGKLNARLKKVPAQERTLLLFYYSGHAQNGELRLGDSRLSLGKLKRKIEHSNADLRLAFLDSCRSGGITRMKGARIGRPIQIEVNNATAQHGLVLLTASSASENAQESDRLQGSFFTHFLSSGLRGAADQNADGKVTLSEVYEYAYANTVERTIGTRGGVQHPTYRFDLHGAGEVVLGRLSSTPSSLTFPRGLRGEFVVFDSGNKVVVADFSTEGLDDLRIGLRAGAYVLKKRNSDHLLMRRLRLGRGDQHKVNPQGWEKVAFADDFAKGSIVTVEDVRRGPLSLRLGTSIGNQTFLSTPLGYLDNIWMTQLSLDVDNLLRRDIGIRMDIAFGTHKANAVSLTGYGLEEDQRLGIPTPKSSSTEYTGGVSLVWRQHPATWLHTAASVRLGAIFFNRSFKTPGSLRVPDQPFGTLTPGLGIEADIDIFPWLRIGLVNRIHYIFFKQDPSENQSQNLAYFDWSLRVTTVLP